MKIFSLTSLLIIQFYSFKSSTNYAGDSARLLSPINSIQIQESLTDIYGDFEQGYQIIKQNDEFFINIGCSFDLYKIKEGKSLQQLYKYKNRGYTCGNYFFSKDNKFYTVFGYGFWNSHSDLMVFDEELGTWEFIFTKNQPLDYSGGLVFKNETGIFSLFGEKINPRTKQKSAINDGFFFNWKEKNWLSLSIVAENDFKDYDFQTNKSAGGVETENYYLFANDGALENKGWFLINKNTLELRFIKKGNFDFLHPPFMEVKDDLIFFKRPNGEYLNLDIENYYDLAQKVGSLKIHSSNINSLQKDKNSIKYYCLVFGVLILLIIYKIGKTKIFKSKKKIATEKTLKNIQKKRLPEKENEYLNVDYNSNSLHELDRIIKDLSLLNKDMITGESLEQIFGVNDSDSFDNKRAKRARFIRELNQITESKTGSILLSRIKDPTDKRFIIYRIDLTALLSLTQKTH